MKAIKYYNLLFYSLLALTASTWLSCKKLIQTPANATNQIGTAQVFADSADAEAAVVEMYVDFSDSGIGLQAAGLTVYPGLSADELKFTGGGTSFENECYTDAIPVNDGTNNGLWTTAYGYSAIYQANSCIQGITSSTGISLSEKNQLTGEAEFMRAFWYFYLVNLYGGVPLVTSTNYLANATLPSATVQIVYSQIISDLKDAQHRLGVNYPTAGRVRPNYYTATALLARVYLYQKDWQDAETAASVIINSGIYSLESNLDNVFLDGSNEAIWQVPFANPNQPYVDEGRVFVPPSASTIPKFVLTSFLLNAFETGDNRQSNWVNSNSVVTGGTAVTYYYPYKYKNGQAQEDYMLFRFAEQYLIRAEAEAALNDLPAAVADLNKIRNRAGLPGYSGAMSSPAVQAAILHERQIELFCELGSRWFDLKRTGAVNAVLGLEKPGIWPADGHAALYPVPLPQIQKNPQLTQNPGY